MLEFYVEKAKAYMRYQILPGEDTPIIFIHGLGCAGSFDYPQVAAQKELRGHTCILIDLLGAGYSDKPVDFPYSVGAHVEYLKEFVDNLPWRECILFGHSLGGPIAIELAEKCLDKVKRLILSEANLDPSTEGAGSYRIAQFTERYFVEKGFGEFVEACKMAGNTMWAATLSNCLPEAVYRLSENAVQGESPSWRIVFYKLPISKSFLFGENSLPDQDYDVLRKQGIHVEIVENAGHSMAWENPQGLAGAVSRCAGEREK